MIVNWNTSAQAVQAARDYASSTGVSTRVFIVDNDSLDDQKKILRDGAGVDFKLVESRENLGYGRAANLGLSQGEGEFVVVSNADVYPEPVALEAMAAAAISPEIGMVGPVFGREGHVYHDQLPGPLTMVVRIFVGSFGRKPVPFPSTGETVQVEQPSGGCFLMSRKVWEATGGFDEGFFLWYEDVDLARRLIDSGKTSVVVGDASVNHVGGESFAKLSETRQQAIRIESVGRYLKLHHPRTYSLSRPLLWLSSRIRSRTSR